MPNLAFSETVSRRVTIANYQTIVKSASPTNSINWRNHDDALVAGENVLDDSESEYDYSSFDFPAPPPFRSPVIRRVKSTPWYSTPRWDDVCKTLQSTAHMFPVYDEQAPSTGFEAFEDMFDLKEHESSTPRAARPLISRLVKRASALSFRDLANWSSSELRLDKVPEQQSTGQHKNFKSTKLRLPNVIRKVASMTYESESDLKNKGKADYKREIGEVDQSLAALGIHQGVVNESSDLLANLAPAFQFNAEWNRQSSEMNIPESMKQPPSRGNERSFIDITPDKGVLLVKSGTKTDGIKRFIARAGGRFLRWRTEGSRTRSEITNG